jgi:hypothetical protein
MYRIPRRPTLAQQLLRLALLTAGALVGVGLFWGFLVLWFSLPL